MKAKPSRLIPQNPAADNELSIEGMADSHCFIDEMLFRNALLSGTAVLIPASSTPHQRRLANCDWMPASYTSGQPSNPRRHSTC